MTTPVRGTRRRNEPLRAKGRGPIATTAAGPAGHVRVTIAEARLGSALRGLAPSGRLSWWHVRFYGSIVLGGALVAGYGGYRILRSAELSGDSVFVVGAVMSLTAAGLVALWQNGRRRHRRKAMRSVAGAVWASPSASVGASEGVPVGGKGVVVLGTEGLVFRALPREGTSGVIPWADVAAVELRFAEARSANCGLDVVTRNGGQVFFHTFVGREVGSALEQLGAEPAVQ